MGAEVFAAGALGVMIGAGNNPSTMEAGNHRVVPSFRTLSPGPILPLAASFFSSPDVNGPKSWSPWIKYH